MSRIFPAIILLFAGVTHAEDGLVGNPGFEQAVVDQPALWDLYLMPQDGAFARLDGAARAGQFAAMIHVPLPYPERPVNNWSQNIFGAFGDQTFRITGAIKTEDVQEAAIWVQCWRKRPLALLETATTAQSSPVYGTMDWTPVEAVFKAPKDTDFLTIRCILKGPGTAWFDEVGLLPAQEVTPETPAPAVTPAAAPATAAAQTPASPPAPVAPATPETAAKPPVPSTPLVTAPVAAPVAPEPPRVERPKPAKKSAATEGVDELRQSNEALVQEVMRLRRELDDLRATRDLPALTPAPAPTPETAVITKPARPRVPPLVPSGENRRTP